MDTKGPSLRPQVLDSADHPAQRGMKGSLRTETDETAKPLHMHEVELSLIGDVMNLEDVSHCSYIKPGQVSTSCALQSQQLDRQTVISNWVCRSDEEQ